MGTAVAPKQKVRISFKGRPGNIVLRDYLRPGKKKYELRDEDGESTTYTLTRTQTFDTSNKFEAQVVDGFMHHPHYAKLLNIVGLEDEASDYIKVSERKLEAHKIIKALGTGARGFARVLGINAEKLSELQLTAALLKKADQTPDRIIEVKNDPSLVKHILLLEGKSAGVFKERDGVWYHNEMPIGQNVKTAVAWLDENKDLIAALQKEVSEKLK